MGLLRLHSKFNMLPLAEFIFQTERAPPAVRGSSLVLIGCSHLLCWHAQHHQPPFFVNYFHSFYYYFRSTSSDRKKCNPQLHYLLSGLFVKAAKCEINITTCVNTTGVPQCWPTNKQYKGKALCALFYRLLPEEGSRRVRCTSALQYISY